VIFLPINIVAVTVSGGDSNFWHGLLAYKSRDNNAHCFRFISKFQNSERKNADCKAFKKFGRFFNA